MDAAKTPYELLAHFDHHSGQFHARSIPVRGVGWVLRWAAALAALFVAGCELTQFAYCLAAERSLVRAARAGAMEATLPRATPESIVQSVERRLANYPMPPGSLRISVQQNGAPVRRAFRPREGNRLCVTLAVPSEAVTPAWLRRAIFWDDNSQIAVRAERPMPGRLLAKLPAS